MKSWERLGLAKIGVVYDVLVADNDFWGRFYFFFDADIYERN
jgi:hypothetical protein